MRDAVLARRLGDEPMNNRIREIREAAGLSSDELGERVGTSGAQIRRLETGERRLTAEWMARIAEALACTPADLIANAILAEMAHDVEEAPIDAVIAQGMGSRGLKAYKVLSKAVSAAGYGIGDTVIVDESQEAVDNVKTGDVVLVEIESPHSKVLRGVYRTQEVTLLLTLRRGANLTVSSDDPILKPAIVGVVIRPE